MTPTVPAGSEKGARVSYAPSASESAIISAAAVKAGENPGTWLRFVVTRAAATGEKLKRPATADEPRGEPRAIRVTVAHRTAIEKAASDAGLGLSEYVIAAAVAEARRLGVK